jgi:hypothetical protein
MRDPAAFGRIFRILLVVFIIFSVSMAVLVILHPTALEGAGTPSQVNYIRNGLELIYFFTNSIVALFAFVALGTATGQIEHAHLARTATIYADVMKMWESESVLRSRNLLKNLSVVYNDNRPDLNLRGIMSPQAYVSSVLFHLRSRKDPVLDDYTALIDVLEYVGLLCRRGYVEKRDLYDFFAGELKVFLELLQDYFAGVRQHVRATGAYVYPDAIFANATWLREEMDEFIPFSFTPKDLASNQAWYMRPPLD